MYNKASKYRFSANTRVKYSDSIFSSKRGTFLASIYVSIIGYSISQNDNSNGTRIHRNDILARRRRTLVFDDVFERLLRDYYDRYIERSPSRSKQRSK